MNRLLVPVIVLISWCPASWAALQCSVNTTSTTTFQLSCGKAIETALTDFDDADHEGIAFRVVERESSGGVDVFLWAIKSESTPQSNEGTYFKLRGYRAEVAPGGASVKLTPGDSISFWGARENDACEATFMVVRIRGFDAFRSKERLKLRRVNCDSHP